MRQAVIAAPERLEVVDAPRPALRGPGEILLRTLASGICSGDLMPWYLARKVGTVFGHEPAGVAVEVGAEVRHVREGDLVFAHHHAPCLACGECRRGAFVHCATWKGSRIDPGGMAEFIRVPAEIVAADCFAVNELTAEQALFIEPLACCAKAMARAQARGRVGVVGCGVMGLLNIQAALALGCEAVAIEPDDARRAMASRWCEAMTPDEAREALKEKLDAVIVGPGFPEAIKQSLAYVRPAGVACLFTPTATGVLTELDLGALYFRDVSLTPSYSCGPEDTRTAYGWIRDGKVDPLPLVTHRFGLEDIQQALGTARRGGACVKAVITFPEG
ncbi:MAG: alcohol dehydrogenase catalytic domain-containing protein [Gemmataceae bacterium]|nr:alcohol dehydrogenase catalytic domain-containing protein [Gemmataceae bacterium]